MQTEKHTLATTDQCIMSHQRLALRQMSEEDWIEKYGSTTVRKAKRLKARYKNQYLEERTAFEFGPSWKLVPSSRVLFNDVMSEGDCHELVEAIWLSDRYIDTSIFSADQFEFKYIHITKPDDSVIEGVGLICRQVTNCPWLPEGQMLYWIQAEYDKQAGRYKKEINL
jgi:hypothetical protein